MDTTVAAETADLEPAARARLDEYLDAMDRRLVAVGIPYGERRLLTDGVEVRVRDALARRGASQPTAEDIAAALEEVDPANASNAGARTGVVWASPFFGLGYEYRSKRTWRGLPLVHITKGINPATGLPRVATAVSRRV